MNRKLFEKQLIEFSNRWVEEVGVEQGERKRIAKAIYDKTMEAFKSKPEWKRWKGLKNERGFFNIDLQILDADNTYKDEDFFQYSFYISNIIKIRINKKEIFFNDNTDWFKEDFFLNVNHRDVFVEIKDIYDFSNLKERFEKTQQKQNYSQFEDEDEDY